MHRLLAAALLLLAAPALAQPVDPPAAASPTGPALDLEGDEPGTDEVSRGPNDNTDRADMYQRTSLLANLTDKLGVMRHKTVLGGYGEVEYHNERGADSHFVHHRYVLFIYSTLHPRISTSTEFEVEFGGSPAKRDGVQGPGEAILEFSVVDFRLTDWMTLRGGIILVPFGAYNIRHDSPTQDLTERPKPLTTIVPSTWFETGVGLLGGWELGDHKLAYEVYAINGLDAKISEEFGMKGAVGSKGEDNNDDKAIVGRVSWSPSLHLEMGVSGYTGEYDDSGNRVDMGGLDLTAKYGWFELQGEYVRAAIDEGFVEGFSPGSPANTRLAVPTGMEGWYLQSNLHFTLPGLWDLLPDDLRDAVLTGIVRYESTDTNTEVENAFDTQKLTFGLNFRPIENYVIKTETQLVSKSKDGQAHHPFSGAWEFTPKFVASLAFLF